MSHDDAFEPGYFPVAALPARAAGRVCVGARGESTRVEFPGDRAFEFDGEGRLVVAQVEGAAWRSTLDRRLVGSRIEGSGPRRRLHRLAEEEQDDLALLARWHEAVGRLLPFVEDAEPMRGEGRHPSTWLPARVERIAAWTEAALRADREAVRALYRPIPVLPPDQYASLVLQASEGCPWDRCTFCSFYRGVPHRIRSREEFAAHLDAVLAHLGRSVLRTRRVFLGQANALLAPTDHLIAILEELLRRLPLSRDRDRPGIDGVYSFIDGFHRPKAPKEFHALRERGLRRVYLGLESGSERLLHELGKPSRNADVKALASSLREGGIALGVIVLVGAGGEEFEAEHVDATARLVRELDLSKGDQVYLSPLVPQEERVLHAAASKSLQRQYETLRDRLRAVLPTGVPIAPYDIERLARTSPRL